MTKTKKKTKAVKKTKVNKPEPIAPAKVNLQAVIDPGKSTNV